MKQPSEENTTQQQDVSEKENMMQQDAPAEEAAQTADENEKISDTESIRLTGEKTPVQRDKTTMHDEVQDFKFLKPKSVRRETSHSHSSSGSGHHHHHHHRRHRKKKMKTWKKVLLIVVSVILALVIAVTGTVIYLVFKGQSELFDVDLRIEVPQSVPAEVQDNGDYIVYDGATYRYNRDVTSLLFMGVDKRNIDGVNEVGTGGQSDVNVLIAINVKSHKLSMVAIPRDTLAEVARYTPSGTYNGMGTMQICLGYAYGNGKETSCDNMVSSVSKLFGSLSDLLQQAQGGTTLWAAWMLFLPRMCRTSLSRAKATIWRARTPSTLFACVTSPRFLPAWIVWSGRRFMPKATCPRCSQS